MKIPVLALLALLWSVTASAILPLGGSDPAPLALSATLPNATVGGDYFTALPVTGGVKPYTCTFNYTISGPITAITGANPSVITISSTGSNPFTGLSQAYIDGALTGAASNYGASTVSIASTAGSSGAFTITTTLNGTNYLTASGGTLRGGAITGVTPWQLTTDCNLFAYTPTAESGTIAVKVTDAASTVVTTSLSFTVNSTLAVMGTNHTSTSQPMPAAWVNASYGGTHGAYNFTAAGGTAPYTYSIAGLPPGESLNSSTGAVTGTPTTSGNYTMVLTVTDNVAAQATATFNQKVLPSAVVTRPSYNSSTANGFFTLNGQLYDPNGNPFTMRGVNTVHATSVNSAAVKRIGQSAFRVAMAAGVDAAVETYIAGSVIANGQFPIATRFFDNSSNNLSGSTITGTTPSGGFAGLGSAVSIWVANFSTWSPILTQSAINIANEWGPLNGSTWRDAYTAVSCAISAMTTTQITCSDTTATNPFAGAVSLQVAYISGAGGVTNQIAPITAVGGSSGAWTITGTFPTGFTTGGNLLGGAVGVMRGAGYNNPLVIDTGGSGQDINDLVNWSAGVYQSDPRKNTIFSFHFYALYQGNIPSTLSQFNAILSSLATLRAATGGVYMFGEFGPPAPPFVATSGGGATAVQIGQFIGGCEDNNFPWFYWAADDNNMSGSQTSQNFYGATLVSGVYTAAADLTYNGLNIFDNPVYGTKALSSLAVSLQ